MIPGLAGAQSLASTARSTLFESVRALAIEPGLKLLIDGGDGLSYPGSGQTVTDRSGNQNMFLGTTSGADGTDALWTGVADARSSAEYFYLAGATEVISWASDPAWIDAIHQDSAKFAIAGWQYATADAIGGAGFVGNLGASYANTGFSFSIAINAVPIAGKMVFDVGNGSGSSAGSAVSSGLVPLNQWSYIALLVDEAAGTFTMWINGSQTNGAITYSSPAAGTGANIFKWSPQVAGSRLGGLAMWQGATPTAAQLGALFQATRDKFGV